MACFQNQSGLIYDSTNTTYISKFSIYHNDITNTIPFVDLNILKDTVATSLNRWGLVTEDGSAIWEQHRQISSEFTDGYTDTYKLFTSWVIIDLEVGKSIKNQEPNRGADYILTMYANGRYRRNGSTVDYYEQVMECLYIQIKNPDKKFSSLSECYEHNLHVEEGKDEILKI